MLRSHFGSQIEEIRLIRDAKTGIPKGFAYIQFESSKIAKQMIENKERFTLFAGTQIKIEPAKSKENALQSHEALSVRMLNLAYCVIDSELKVYRE